jgi:signal transduction histidine kinase
MSLITRVVFLTALPVVAGLQGKLTGDVAYVLIGWIGISLASSLMRGLGWQLDRMDDVEAVVDVSLAIVLISLSGDLASPLWWCLLLGPLRLSLARGLQPALIVFALGTAVYVLKSFLFNQVGLGSFLSLATLTGSLLLALLFLGWLAGQVRRIRFTTELGREGSLGQDSDLGQEHVGNVFRMAAELNAILDIETVWEMVLDLSMYALSDSGPANTDLVSVLLLRDENRLRIASARRLTHADRLITVPGIQGLLAEALKDGEPHLTLNPGRDPELKNFEAFQGCQVAYCFPLTTEVENIGFLLFGHSEQEFFSPGRISFMRAVTTQAMTALLNAQAFHELEEEKERMTEIQDEARRKLARDLHDGPTQTIAAIAMRVNFARRMLERDPGAAAEELSKVENIARRTTKDIRHMLFTLRPLILESKGLVAALEQLAEKVRQTHDQNISIEAEKNVALGMDMGKQSVVFYIAEEAVNNARKHAEAEHIWVRLMIRDDFFVLEIEDDGVGFNVGSVDANYEQRGSLGMVSMRERAELVNGGLHVDTTEGKGTQITLFIPISVESLEDLHRTGLAH